MSDIFGRIIPGIRNSRNPLIIGYSWVVIIWGVLAKADAEETPVGELATKMFGDVSDVALGVGLTAIIAIVGAGLTRLMDRLMQLMTWHRDKHAYNPLDRAEKYFVDLKSPERDPDYTTLLETYLATRLNPERDRWQMLDDEVHPYELQLYRRHLVDEPEFGALQAEQLLRFSLLPPLLTSLVLTLWWSFADGGRSAAILCGSIALIYIIVFLDYRRTGTLIRRRWRRLVHEYPDWLPEKAAEQRERFFELRPEHNSARGTRGGNASTTDQQPSATP